MEPISITPATTLSQEDRDALWRAKQYWKARR